MPKRCKLKQLAREQNLIVYKGSQCKYNHDGMRYLKNGGCKTCHLIACKAWQVVYRSTKKGKEYQRNYQAIYKKDPANKEKLDVIKLKHRIKKRYNGSIEEYEEAQAYMKKRKAINAKTEARRAKWRKGRLNDKR